MIFSRFIKVKRKRSESREGFTILGILFAAAFSIATVAALVGLTVQLFSGSRVSKERFIATALAREGIELVRSLRDDNWFAYNPHDPISGGTITEIKWRGDPNPPGADEPDLTRSAVCNGTWVIDPDMDSLQAGSGELYLDAGRYTHDAGGDETLYTRVITIETLGTGTGDCGDSVDGTDDANAPDPVLVTSQITWGDPVNPRSVQLQEILYDWVRVR